VNKQHNEQIPAGKNALSRKDPGEAPHRAWRILIVDSDPRVHDDTLEALRGTLIANRPLTVLHAYSTAQAYDILDQEKEIAAVLLSTTIEAGDASLHLIKAIREELGLQDLRIILHAKHACNIPQIDAINRYDISACKTAAELTPIELHAALSAAIHAYRHIHAINLGRDGLNMIVQASADFMTVHGLSRCAAGVTTQLAALMGISPEGLVCAQEDIAEHGNLIVIAAAGRYANQISQPLTTIDHAGIRDLLQRSLRERRNLYAEHGTTLFFQGNGYRDVAAYLESGAHLDHFARNLLHTFCTNIAAGFQNAALFSKLQTIAYNDPLSRLPNRFHFVNQINLKLRSPERNKYSLALLDIDHFAETNDALGHNLGDRLLQAIAQRLKSSLYDDVIIARTAGDTFGLLGPSVHLTPSNLTGQFQEPFAIDDEEVLVSVTIGLLNLSDTGNNGSDALKEANIALKRAKQHRRGEVSYYTREMGVEIQERVKLLQALRHAFDNDKLFLVYQPQINLSTGNVVGVEALIRWRTDDGKMVPPGRFIPLAEHSGLIVSIGEWVLRVACLQQARLARQGFGHIRIAINVSVSQFRHPRFPFVLRRALENSGADPRCIELEITESMAMEDADTILHTFAKIKKTGITLAIDDFGTGFSSLSYLQRLAVDRLKIDRSFINELTTSERGAQIPEVVIQLGQRLGLQIVAEGVEEASQAERLRELGCHEAQGYYFGRPMEVPVLMEWLNTHQVQPV